MSHRRTEELNLAFNLRADDYDHVIFATSDTMKCFSCGKEGHLIREKTLWQGRMFRTRQLLWDLVDVWKRINGDKILTQPFYVMVIIRRIFSFFSF